MKILITGGADFIGSAIARHVVEDSDDAFRMHQPDTVMHLAAESWWRHALSGDYRLAMPGGRAR